MRLRNKPWALDYINEHQDVIIPEPERFKGNWQEVFGNNNPVHIEVGTGKGQFVLGMAKQNPDINYIGIELYDSVIVCALEKIIEAEKPSNLRLLKVNGADLQKYFNKGDVERVYLNFSDPWPKARHAKRRLTHEGFLAIYESILVDNGEIYFKTDDDALFTESLTYFKETGFEIEKCTYDLENEPNFWNNVETEHEKMFKEEGIKIKALIARKR